MAKSEVPKEGDDNLLEFPKIDDMKVELSQEEIDALLEIDIENGENSEVDEIDDLVTDALIAKLVLRRSLVSRGGDFPVEDWRNCYNQEAGRIKSSLNRVVAESNMDFSDIQRERFAKMGIVTFRDLCLLSEEELRKVGFEDLEIESIQAILRRFKLWLMG